MKEWGFDRGERSLSQMLRKMRVMHSQGWGGDGVSPVIFFKCQRIVALSARC